MILTELLEATNLTNNKLANLAGLHHSTIDRYVNGTGNLTEEYTNRIAKVIASRLQIAYVAGLFDRCFSWSIVKVEPNPEKYRSKYYGRTNTGPINIPVYSARIRFYTKHRLLAKVLEQVLGVGFIIPVKNRGKNRGNIIGYQLFVANRKAKNLIELLYPYLILKRKEAELILKCVSILEKRPGVSGLKLIIATHTVYKTTRVFTSIQEAANLLNTSSAIINSGLNGRQRTIKNGTYTVEYGDLQDNTSYLEELDKLYIEMKVRKTR